MDYVSRNASLAETVGRAYAYDYIIGSNVVEHMVDFVGFLQDCDALLKPEGRLSIAVPDLRYCFDLLRPPAAIGAVIDAHQYPTRFHTPGTLFESTTYACLRGGEEAWNRADDRPVTLRAEGVNGPELVQRGIDQAEYYDIHRWTFTPASFSLLVQDLRDLGYHTLGEVREAPSIGFEFFVTLGHADPPPRRNRLELLQTIRSELAVVAELDRLGPTAVQLESALAEARNQAEELRTQVAAKDKSLADAERRSESLALALRATEEALRVARGE